MKDITIRFE